MGMWLTKLVNEMEEMHIVMMGLDCVGKTTILYQLKLQKVVDTIPTQGFNVESLEYNNIKFTLWDVGGQQRYKIRDLWKHYFREARALVYVVDSNDPGRIEEARDELHTMLQQDALRDAVLLVLANKQDCPNAMTTSEINTKLQLHSISHHPWYIQATCATSGEGLYEGLDWLSSSLSSHAS